MSLIGTFAGFFVLGYSINTLTLFGMVLAIGIVVDDAIVVLENVERIMREENAAPREAAIKAMHEVTGPIIAIVLTLTAVFVPIAFLGGLTGELYRQFAVTISIAVVISGIVALTLSPALCALILVAATRSRTGASSRCSTAGSQRVTAHYTTRRRLDDPPRYRRRRRFSPAWSRSPSDCGGSRRAASFPTRIRAFYIRAVILPDGATLRAHRQGRRASRSGDPLATPTMRDIISFTGFDFIGGGFRNNAATIFVTQMPWDERKVTAPQLVGELYGKTARDQGSAGARVQSAADLRPRHRRAATSSTSRIAAKAARSA